MPVPSPASLGLAVTGTFPDHWKCTCPFHHDEVGSLAVYKDDGHFHCFGCQEHGSWEQLQRRLDPNQPSPTTELAEDLVRKLHDNLLAYPDHLGFLEAKRALSRETIARFQLGWSTHRSRFTIPIRDHEGRLVNIRCYDPEASSAAKKMISWAKGLGSARLWPQESLAYEELLLCEGELDALCAIQRGFHALTATAGAGTWKPEWNEAVRGKTVYLAQDNDDAGRKGNLRIAGALHQLCAVRLVQWPSDFPAKGDITDFFLTRDADDFRALLLDARDFATPAPAEPTEKAPLRVSLQQAALAANTGKRLAFSAMVAGKDMQPFQAPAKVAFACPMRCKAPGACKLAESGNLVLTFHATSPFLLNLISCSDTQQTTMLRAAASIPRTCRAVTLQRLEDLNIEEAFLIPDLDSSPYSPSTEEYVRRTAFYVGYGLRANRTYELVGFTGPEPKQQYTVHVLESAVPAQDNIEAFTLAPDIRERLTVFQGDPAEKWADIYRDHTLNVHRIVGRPELQIAFDLVFHSPLAFHFGGRLIRKGWVEGLVLGDSGQAKTVLAEALLAHYRLGERISGEHVSAAGLIGGLSQTARNSWILNWGKIPLNDRRALVIDECGDVKPEDLEKLSDMRSTGIVEIVKVRTERTWARTRLLFLSNPREGRILRSLEHGVEAIRGVFRKSEDIRRLDFAITVASGEVSATLINEPLPSPGPPRYSSDACHDLLLWAWSRTPDQVIFPPDTCVYLRTAAETMADWYSPHIPLVEPADQGLKLARLAAACAARFYSCDRSGEKVLVQPEHADFVVEWLRSQYNKPAMAYDSYSRAKKALDELSDSRYEQVREALRLAPDAHQYARLLLDTRAISRNTLMDLLDLDQAQARKLLGALHKLRLLTHSARGYVKTPAFIVALHRVLEEGESDDA